MGKRMLLVLALLTTALLAEAQPRHKYNFNSQWLLMVGDIKGAETPGFDDSQWQRVTLPHPFNEDEAFCKGNEEVTDTVMWYRKHFRLPKSAKGQKVFIEFEGARQAIDVFVNGKAVGYSENGVMAFGFDITPYINYGKENVIATRIDNDWDYRERSTNTKFQWSDRNFNANYGGLTKNVWLHTTPQLYQTLPLYSNLGTTGTYIYAKEINIGKRKAVIHAQSQVRNETRRKQNVQLEERIYDRDGTLLATALSDTYTIEPGTTALLDVETPLSDVHFWSWGYGYLYKVTTALMVDGKRTDEVNTRTGFRKTRFGDGMFWLNDRVLQLKGYAQRTSNEWPAVGLSVPAWLSDYSNGLMVEANANLVRWMHVTPWKQDVESCDRVGLMQAMPAGDAEKDREGVQWMQRKRLMRDAIIYNRNNPSIIFYESGNESISREHMLEMVAIRDSFDFYGGRAIGSREMLDIDEAEYGGEMLYINKSAKHPMWATEYCRDEGLRKYWDEQSFPYHKEGVGSTIYRSVNGEKRKMDTRPYNHNQDEFARENVIRWYDYFRERPGTGRRVSSGGVRIIFSDTNTHCRGEANYRTSGDVDPMRIPKDCYFAHQVMWDGWVDIEQPRVYIIGHWNYTDTISKRVMVVANTDSVALFLNGTPLPQLRQEYQFLFTLDSVRWAPGTLQAIAYNKGQEVARHKIETAGQPAALRLTAISDPQGWRADGADMALAQVEVVDAQGRRCPLANNTVHFSLSGPAEWRGGIAQGPGNCILAKDLPVECGINRALIRSTTQAGEVILKAEADGLQPATITLSTVAQDYEGGLGSYIAAERLPGVLRRGETPRTPSFTVKAVDVPIVSARSGCNADNAMQSYDDNELSEWKNDGRLSTAWITYRMKRVACIDEVCLKLTGWRLRSYPLEIFADGQLIWSGNTEKSLGYIHLKVKPVTAREITIRLKGAGRDEDAFGGIVEVVEPAAGELDLFKANGGEATNCELRIVEVELKETLPE